MATDANLCKLDQLDPLVERLKQRVQEAAREGAPAHVVEGEIFSGMLQVGRQLLGAFFAMQGDGDVGETFTTPDGKTLRRLEKPHRRGYRSIFGRYELQRAVYGTREGQAIELAPLDSRLALPEGDYSYLLQQWSQRLAVEVPFHSAQRFLEEMLGLKTSTDSLERINHRMAEEVDAFRASTPPPKPEEEGAIVVCSADGKGVPVRRPNAEKPIEAHGRKGPKPDSRKMATVGAVYSVDPHHRTAEDIVEALFREPGEEAPAAEAKRPKPAGKELRASLPRPEAGPDEPTGGTEEIFAWLAWRLDQRNAARQKTTVYLMDGQESLWNARQEYLPEENAVEILDLLHVTPRLWEAARVFHRPGSAAAETFVKQRLLRVLRGGIEGVIGGLRQMATKAGLRGAKRRTITRICNYLHANRHRTRYDEYLARGFPIASGVIEGACRHVVKDRMERAGMRWTLPAAQAMLDVRCTWLNGDWEAFQAFRIDRVTQRLHPYRQALQGPIYALCT